MLAVNRGKLVTHARLLQLAHPAYAAGFAAAGIEVERIPNIARMSEQLTSFRAVCVDGFIPPRAFQAFQARGLLLAVDPKSVLCPNDTCRYLTDAGSSIYMDDNHVSIGGANLLHDEIARCFERVTARR